MLWRVCAQILFHSVYRMFTILLMLMFNDDIRSSDSVISNGRMIRKGYRLKWLWPNLKYYPGFCLRD
jgi:hypothetical protein